MRCFSILVAVVLACHLVVTPANAKNITIKLGTLAPDGSSWHVLLKQMAERWSQVSEGKVKLKIFPGGVAGNEGDMVRKLRVGQLQAAALTVVGLHDIETAPIVLSCPGLIADDKEWEHVFGKMTPVWEKRFLEKGFVVLMWGDTGWVHMFLKRKVQSPVEMKGMKVFAWAGDSASIDAFKLAGFQPVVLSATDMLPALSTRMIEGFASTSIMAMTARWYEHAQFMTSTVWAHLPGATIVSKKAWERIPSDIRPELMRIAREFGVKVNAEVTVMQSDAIDAMKKNGLKVIEFDAAGQQQWRELAERTWPAVRGGIVSETDFDEVKKLRDEYRASHE